MEKENLSFGMIENEYKKRIEQMIESKLIELRLLVEDHERLTDALKIQKIFNEEKQKTEFFTTFIHEVMKRI